MENDVRLVIISVIERIDLYANAKGLATRRLGTECLPFPPEQQIEVRRARGQIDWSAEGSGVAVSDLSQAEFERVRRLLRTSDRQELAALRDRALLEAMRLVTRHGAVTNAGVLLLGGEDLLRSAVPSHGYSYQYRPSPGSEATYVIRGNRAIPAAVEALLDLVDARAESRPLNLAGGVQLSLTDFPSRAVREVVVNGLVHRAFPGTGTVDIEHAPERLTTQSPGGLVAGVTPENILTPIDAPTSSARRSRRALALGRADGTGHRPRVPGDAPCRQGTAAHRR